jgi:pyruvate kinase
MSALNPQPELDSTLLRSLCEELLALRACVRHHARLMQVHECSEHFRLSALNLAHYLELRQHDIRPLQLRLAQLGLSSLGRLEAHCLYSIDAVLALLHRLLGEAELPPESGSTIDFYTGRTLTAQHADTLLGTPPMHRQVRIMVTMPSTAADDPRLIRDLLQQGMDCMRVNCAHDHPEAWMRMINHLRNAQKEIPQPCRILMDLAGPKIRTGPVEPGPQVLKVRPLRDAFGRAIQPALVWLTSQTQPAPPPQPVQACLKLDPDWLQKVRDETKAEQLVAHQSAPLIELQDARQSKRRMRVLDVRAEGVLVALDKTTYFTPTTTLTCHNQRVSQLQGIPIREGALHLALNDVLILTADQQPGRAAVRNELGEELEPARIGCTLPSILPQTRPGQSIWFDDGKIGGVIEKVLSDHLVIRIRQIRAEGAALKADKGINLPETRLSLPALTAKDQLDLVFATQHADMIGLSFVGSGRDVQELHQAIAKLTPHPPGIILKIETRKALDNLPDILFAAMRGQAFGVMIARGDLAVECGFERLAEVQEEILWLCEAAHTPVIWATQVLENLARTGLPSRAEITDAAMSDRAECVMLNKGPHIIRAVQALDDILQRMQQHQHKKSPMLRALRLAGLPESVSSV